jgi:chorismate lyase/3-hydroxybenzoate synthase
MIPRARSAGAHQITLPSHSLPQSIADPLPHLSPTPPQWVDDALGAAASRCDADSSVAGIISGPLLLLRTTVADARAMEADRLRSCVADAYVAIGGALTASNRQPIRFWNFIPDPGEQMGGGLDRYMVFNAGRYDGYTRWHGDASKVGPSLATASGVGTTRDDLVIHCLASVTPGIAVENPRQKPAWRYSARYGPMPPCFSRATIARIGDRRLLLIGGTASITGEDSQHAGNVDAQLLETLNNLDALIGTALGGADGRDPLTRLIDLRVYLARPDDAPAIRERLEARCPRATRIDMAIARVCRPELLVEIEGVAEL